MHLGEVDKQEYVKITKILLSESDRNRLRQLDIVEGKKIRLIETTLFNDPMLFQIDDNLVAIRRRDAQNIMVERLVP